MKTNSLFRVFRFLAILTVVVWGIWTQSVPEIVAKGKIMEGISLSSPAREKFDILCDEGKLLPGLQQDDPEIGLEPPGAYQGTHVKSVTLSILKSDTGMITVVFNELAGSGIFGLGTRIFIKDGDTWVFRGICSYNVSTWSIDPASSLPKKYRPKSF